MNHLNQVIAINSVITLLNGIDVDGETMEYIINKVGMRDQMKSQLGIESQMPEAVITQIAEDITADLDNEGLDLIEDQEYGINANELFLQSVTYDRYRMEQVVKHVLRSHFTPME
jgi:hypothetical protein